MPLLPPALLVVSPAEHPPKSRVHMVPLRDISPEGLTIYLHKHQSRFDRIIGFRPTGWTCVFAALSFFPFFLPQRSEVIDVFPATHLLEGPTSTPTFPPFWLATGRASSTPRTSNRAEAALSASLHSVSPTASTRSSDRALFGALAFSLPSADRAELPPQLLLRAHLLRALRPGRASNDCNCQRRLKEVSRQDGRLVRLAFILALPPSDATQLILRPCFSLLNSGSRSGRPRRRSANCAARAAWSSSGTQSTGDLISVHFHSSSPPCDLLL